MERLPELVLGNVHINFFDKRRFVFKDLHDPERSITINEVDAADLILFLHDWSPGAKEKVSVNLRSGAH